MQLFTRFTKASGAKDVLTEDVVIQSVKMQRDDPEMKKSMSDVLISIFTAMDANHDGHLDFEEFHRAFDHSGMVDIDFIRGVFDDIDVNHDGTLSIEEYVKAVIDYMCSDDEATTAVFGPLV